MTRRPRLVTIDVDELRRIVRGEVQVVRVRQATLERLAAATGRPVGEDVVGQIVAVLDRVKA